MSQRVKVKQILSDDKAHYEVTVKGWVRSFRNNQFIALNDGSTNNNLQIVINAENTDAALIKRITTGAAISATGEIIPSLGKGQKVELKANTLEILGDCDPEKYPLQLLSTSSVADWPAGACAVGRSTCARKPLVTLPSQARPA